jgi:hypothetical protein
VDKGRRSHHLVGSGMLLVLGEQRVGGVETGVGIGVVKVAETRVRIRVESSHSIPDSAGTATASTKS